MKRTTKLSKRQQKFAAWVEALRSGKYEQGEAQLRTGPEYSPRYCCLGVYCVLRRPEQYLWTSFPDQPVISLEVDVCLADLNDAGVPFEVIAGVIHHNFVVPS